MRLELIAKDESSGHTGCHAVYRHPSGKAAIQGDLADAETWAAMENKLPGEGGLLISWDVLINAVTSYHQNRT